MSALEGLEPDRVFYWFEELTKIPHGSGNVKQISDFLADFGRSRGLETIQDDVLNVIIKKPASAGYDDQPGLIIQGHMDMVAVSKPGTGIDMKKDSLKPYIDGGFIRAKDTSLGGDDGIAVAYALAILEDDSILHPALEVIITTEEEVGMDGARGLDMSHINGTRLLNLDSEDEGHFLAGCAGGVRAHISLNLENADIPADAHAVRIKVSGLLGGHSGNEIHKGRGNANKIAGRILNELVNEKNIRLALCDIEGGLADNAIPGETEMILMVAAKDRDIVDRETDRLRAEISAELATKDPDFKLEISSCDAVQGKAYDAKKIAMLLAVLPDGVQAMSADVPGLVETSLNLGMLGMKDGCVSLTCALRSSVESSKYELVNRLRALCRMCGADYSLAGDYPGWKFRADSPLRDKMVRVFKDMYDKEPIVEAIHAGLECGILMSKKSDLDCVSIGPDMYDIHTTEEHLSISSTVSVWNFLIRLLADKE